MSAATIVIPINAHHHAAPNNGYGHHHQQYHQYPSVDSYSGGSPPPPPPQNATTRIQLIDSNGNDFTTIEDRGMRRPAQFANAIGSLFGWIAFFFIIYVITYVVIGIISDLCTPPKRTGFEFSSKSTGGSNLSSPSRNRRLGEDQMVQDRIIHRLRAHTNDGQARTLANRIFRNGRFVNDAFWGAMRDMALSDPTAHLLYAAVSVMTDPDFQDAASLAAQSVNNASENFDFLESGARLCFDDPVPSANNESANKLLSGEDWSNCSDLIDMGCSASTLATLEPATRQSLLTTLVKDDPTCPITIESLMAIHDNKDAKFTRILRPKVSMVIEHDDEHREFLHFFDRSSLAQWCKISRKNINPKTRAPITKLYSLS
jgi:hypothetical protein